MPVGRELRFQWHEQHSITNSMTQVSARQSTKQAPRISPCVSRRLSHACVYLRATYLQEHWNEKSSKELHGNVPLVGVGVTVRFDEKFAYDEIHQGRSAERDDGNEGRALGVEVRQQKCAKRASDRDAERDTDAQHERLSARDRQHIHGQGYGGS